MSTPPKSGSFSTHDCCPPKPFASKNNRERPRLTTTSMARAMFSAVVSKRAVVIKLTCLALLLGLPGEAIEAGVGDLFVSPDCESDRVLRLQVPHMRGNDVLELQRGLKSQGYYQGPLDGVFGEGTAAAVKALKRAAGLNPDDVVNARVWQALAGMCYMPAARRKLPRPEGEVELVVDLNRRKLTVWANGEPYAEYPVAIGRPGSPSQIGEYRIVDKYYNPGGPFGTRWMGLSVPWGRYGIHGTNMPWSIGTAASGGCIRMYNEHVEEVFEWVSVGTKVTIIGRDLKSELRRPVRTPLKEGVVGKDVQYLQLVMREHGFDPGILDGVFGERLTAAVKRMQSYYGLPPTGSVGKIELFLLGIDSR